MEGNRELSQHGEWALGEFKTLTLELGGERGLWSRGKTWEPAVDIAVDWVESGDRNWLDHTLDEECAGSQRTMRWQRRRLKKYKTLSLAV